jgi:hypothetical protein
LTVIEMVFANALWHRLPVVLGALALVAVAVSPGLAQDAGGSAGHDAGGGAAAASAPSDSSGAAQHGSSGGAGDGSGANAPSGGSHGAPGDSNAGGGKNDRPPAGKDANPIDTNNAFVPRGAGPEGRQDAESKPKLQSSTHNIFRPRANSTPRPGAVERNAIGAAVAPHDDPAHMNHGVSPPGRAPGPAGTLNAAPKLGTPGVPTFGQPGRGQVPATPAAGPAVSMHRGSVTGTGMIRPNANSGTLGGPAKPAPGVNGSTVRPRY